METEPTWEVPQKEDKDEEESIGKKNKLLIGQHLISSWKSRIYFFHPCLMRTISKEHI